ncbi:group 2 allergen Blo t 2-like isoform 8 [Leptotrombidium deliense]|uniref:Group 2 allergen Blo t 2-like isoform 8 n=1 Tax=Leptotrombidium deliense TaxID=299467 RepID=A0A443S866_9ACAR|nr:group 2 allergen Blo t 2-like isoform 8 [Leptotrombidium deliense]
MKLLVFCFLSFSCVAFAKLVSKTDCANKEVQSVDITPCAGEPCTLTGGQDATITLVFVSNQQSDKLNLGGSVSKKIFATPMTFMNIPDTNVCEQAGCPIESGEKC